MAIEGIEWLFVGVIALLLFLWEPELVPKLAKTLAEARREFERASRELEEGLDSPPPPRREESDEKLLEVARSLGVETEGKTRDQIAKEIIEKSKDNVAPDTDEKNEGGEPASSKV